MLLRPADTRDLSRLAEITVTSLRDDPTFDYQWQNRRTYPDDNVFFWHVNLKRMLYEPRVRLLVVELEDGDEPAEPLSPSSAERIAGARGAPAAPAPNPRTVISYGIWERVGKSRGARKCIKDKSTWLNRLDSFSAAMERWLMKRKKLVPRRDGSPAREAALTEASASVRREVFHSAGIRDWWAMELLVTDRRYRRRGAASRLVAEGLGWADAEGAWAGVEASPMGESVYARFGFEKVSDRTVKVEGERDELSFAVMLRRPRPG